MNDLPGRKQAGQHQEEVARKTRMGGGEERGLGGGESWQDDGMVSKPAWKQHVGRSAVGGPRTPNQPGREFTKDKGGLPFDLRRAVSYQLISGDSGGRS